MLLLVCIYLLCAAVIETLDSCSARVRINCREVVTNNRDCEYSAMWHVRGDEIQFTVTANTTGWVAIGFSDTPSMVSLYLSQLLHHIAGKHVTCI